MLVGRHFVGEDDSLDEHPAHIRGLRFAAPASRVVGARKHLR
jgi:hypothetical protein